MVEVVVFGKPRSFESYEFDFGVHRVQEVENSHHEPIIKPIGYNDVILHYYQKDGIAGWEVYRRCQGYDSDRPGIIFGVGIKSDKDFGLIDTMGNLLMPLWEDFAQAFLDKNYKFKFESIVSALKTTKWSPEEEEKVRNNVSGEDVKTAQQEKQLLLLSIDNPNEIKSIEGSIKEFNDVYIASSPSIFQNIINKDVLAKQANNEIRIVKDRKIVLLQKTNPEKPANEKNGNKSWITWIWGGKGSNSSNPETKGTGGDRKDPNNLHKLVATAAVIALIVAIVCFFFFKSKPADRIKLAQPENGYIIDSFNLQPELFHGESKRTSTGLEDIEWKVEGNGRQYVEWNPQETYIKINKNYYQNKPRQETQVTVTARLGGKDLCEQIYKIKEYQRPKANTLVLNDYDKPIQEWLLLTPVLSHDGDIEVSTKINEVSFTTNPANLAEIKYENNQLKLKVKERPEKDTEITIAAYLDNTTIGSKKYTIAKKNELPIVGTPNITGKILCKKRSNYSANYQSPSSFSITMRDYNTYSFIAQDNTGQKYQAGGWKCSSGITLSGANQNPMNITGISASGNYTLEYWVDNQKRATMTITITD